MAAPTLTIRLRPVFSRRLRARAEFAQLSIEHAAAELIEAGLANFSETALRGQFAFPPRGEWHGTLMTPQETSRQKVDVAKAKQILRALDQGVPVVQIASRNAVSGSTIRRIRDSRERYDPAPEEDDDEEA